MTIFQQTGWRRPHPKAICQDMEALERVNVLTYDLSCSAFVDYFIGRTGVDIRSCKCGWERVAGVLANPLIPTADSSWLITRAKLQDCWELFSNNQPAQGQLILL